MDSAQLIDTYPRLYHMATAGSWPSIRDNGLWTTEQIALGSGLSENEIYALSYHHRPHSVALDHPTLGQVVIRDQAALRPVFAPTRITDLTMEEWVNVLNRRVFFWLHRDRLLGLLQARRYNNLDQDVIVVDTASLIAAHGPYVELSPINSGATIQQNAPIRGSFTFQPIERYPFAERRRGRSLKTAIAELSVVDGVNDIAQHVLNVERWRGGTLISEQTP